MKSLAILVARDGRLIGRGAWIALLALSLLLALWAGIWGMAAVQEALAERQWQRWVDAGFPPDSDEDAWSTVIGLLEHALALDPDHPGRLARLGDLYRMRAERVAGAPERMLELRGQAVAAYERSLLLRPVSAETWINLAGERARLPNPDWQQVSRDLERGYVLGPWERGTLLRGVRLGLLYEKRLDAALRRQVEDLAGRALLRYPHTTMPLLLRHGRLVRFADLYNQDPRLKKMAERLLAAPRPAPSTPAPARKP
ncbi:MAG: hypothetical protein H7831_10505 [Magnetococcus sp. WYHC-3]